MAACAKSISIPRAAVLLLLCFAKKASKITYGRSPKGGIARFWPIYCIFRKVNKQVFPFPNKIKESLLIFLKKNFISFSVFRELRVGSYVGVKAEVEGWGGMQSGKGICGGRRRRKKKKEEGRCFESVN